MKEKVLTHVLQDVNFAKSFKIDKSKKQEYTTNKTYPSRAFLVENNQRTELASCRFNAKFFLDFLNDKEMQNFFFETYKDLKQSCNFVFENIDFCLTPMQLKLAFLELQNEGKIDIKKHKIFFKKLDYLTSYDCFFDNINTLEFNEKTGFSKPKIIELKRFFDPNFNFSEYAKNKSDNFDFRCNLFLISQLCDELNLEDYFSVPQKIKQRIEDAKNYAFCDFENVEALVEPFQDLDIYDKRKKIVSPELKEFILKDMPQNLDDLEKALYVYFKMCQTLRYDTRYYIHRFKPIGNHTHRDVEKTKLVDPQNPDVICSEFTAIYCVLLREMNIKAKLYSSAYSQTGHEVFPYHYFPFNGCHVWTEFDAGKFSVSADAVPVVIRGDIALFKYGVFEKIFDGSEQRGLFCKNSSVLTKLEFEEKMWKIINLVRSQQQQKNEEAKQKSEDILTKMEKRYLTYEKAENINKKLATNYPLSYSMRLNFLFKLVENVDLHNLELAQYLHLVSKKIFKQEENKKYDENALVKFSYLREPAEPLETKTAVLMSFRNPYKDKNDKIYYCLLDGKQKPKFLTKQQIEERFKKGTLIQNRKEAEPLGFKS